MSWFPLHCHSHFSLLDGLSKPEQIAQRIEECGYEGSALTDHGTVAGCPGFLKVMQKKKKKAILGCEFYICRNDATQRTAENASLSHLCVLARTKQGWKNLMRASSASCRPEVSYRKPRLDLERLASYSQGQFIVFSGHLGSDLANICFEQPKAAYSVRDYESARSLVHKDWKNRVMTEIHRYQTLFGKENFYLEIQLVDQKNLPASLVVARILRHCAQQTGTPTVATADSHYCRKEDAADQRVLLCSALDTTMKEVYRRLEREEDVQLGAFFRSNNYHIPSLEEMRDLHGDHPEELENACEIARRCEDYTMGGKPLFPSFVCPDGLTPDAYLEQWCREGWKEKIAGKVSKTDLPKYEERLWNLEMPVIRGTEGFLASYFLVKADIIRYANRDLGVITGKGRGSAAGCLVSYLTGITRVDPIRYDLIFERFYNAGRNSPGRIALPDIDSDFPLSARDKVIQYIRDKYGSDRVAQMVTFSRMQGRGALKDVLRAHERCSFDEMNRITEHIPDEAEIADQLQEMREETGEASIIQWALLHNGDALREWVTLREDGTLDGPLALDFAQAIRLEGTKRNMGKHASGLILCSEPLADICPMVYDKSTEEMVVGLDMRDAEEAGLVKLDLLGLRTLECLKTATQIVRTGKIEE
jgi:DNA polymerase-3 subunit alpha